MFRGSPSATPAPRMCSSQNQSVCTHEKSVHVQKKPVPKDGGAAPEECPQHSRSACAQQPARTRGRGHRRGFPYPWGLISPGRSIAPILPNHIGKGRPERQKLLPHNLTTSWNKVQEYLYEYKNIQCITK